MRVQSDNVGNECTLRKGLAKSQDHNRIIHAMWLMAAKLNWALWVGRVGTHDNIADDPSREHCAKLVEENVEWIQPYIPRKLHGTQLWDDLSFCE